jgi:hypothetical protein
MLGTYSSAKATPAAVTAIANLLAWRLDLAHVDPTSRLVWTSLGSPRYPGDGGESGCGLGPPRQRADRVPGTALWKPASEDRGHRARDRRPQDLRAQALGSLGGPIRFTARISASLPWTVEVRDAAEPCSRQAPELARRWTGRGTRPRDGGALTATRSRRAPTCAPRAGRSAIRHSPSRASASRQGLHANGDKVTDRAAVTIGVSKPALLALWLENAQTRRGEGRPDHYGEGARGRPQRRSPGPGATAPARPCRTGLHARRAGGPPDPST